MYIGRYLGVKIPVIAPGRQGGAEIQPCYFVHEIEELCGGWREVLVKEYLGGTAALLIHPVGWVQLIHHLRWVLGLSGQTQQVVHIIRIGVCHAQADGTDPVPVHGSGIDSILSVGSPDEYRVIVLSILQVVKIDPHGTGRNKGIIERQGNPQAKGREQDSPGGF